MTDANIFAFTQTTVERCYSACFFSVCRPHKQMEQLYKGQMKELIVVS